MSKICTRCDLHKTAVHSNCIWGEGSKTPTYIFVGEAPGRTEDLEGKPFVGQVGSTFRQILFEDLGFPKPSCYFTNATRCWPGEGNPTPKDGHISACRPYLELELKELLQAGRQKPVIVMLGATSLKSVAKKTGVTKLRGTAWEDKRAYYVVTYHPSYAFNYGGPEGLNEFVQDLKLAYRLPTEGLLAQDVEPVNWLVVDNFSNAMDLLGVFERWEAPLSHDYETSGSPHSKDFKILSVSYAVEPCEAVSIPLEKSDGPFSHQEVKRLLQRIEQLHQFRFEKGITFEAYSATTEIKAARAKGWQVPLLSDDPYLAHHLIKEDMASPSLKQLAWFYTDRGGYEKELDEYVANHPEADPTKEGGSYDAIPWSILGPYGAADADVSLRIARKLRPQLEEEGLLFVYQNITLPASYVMAEYELNGMKIDREFMESLAISYPQRMEETQAKARRLKDVQKFEAFRLKQLKAAYRVEVETKRKEWEAKEEERLEKGYKPRKPPSYGKKITYSYKPSPLVEDSKTLLFDFLKLPVVKKTDTGKPSLDEDAREQLRDRHPKLIDLMDEYIYLQKFFGSYIKRVDKRVTDKDFYHGWFNLAGTVTGRLSSDLQQIPRVGTNKDVRQMFVSRFGDEGTLLEVDVSQGEMRMMYLESRDEALGYIFENDLDAHMQSAEWLEENDPGLLSSLAKDPGERRALVKASISFGIMYGRQKEAVAEEFGWSLDKAQRFIETYFGVYWGVKQRVDEFKAFASKHGYIANLLGRRRRLPDINSDEPGRRARAQRQAVNHPIQSLLHDFMLFASCIVLEEFERRKLRSKMCAEAHDSNYVDVFKPELTIVLGIYQYAFNQLEKVFDFVDIPIKIDAKAGPNLAELEDLNLSAR